MQRGSPASRRIDGQRGESVPCETVAPLVAGSSFSIPFLWPLVALASASETAAFYFGEFAHGAARRELHEPGWATPNRVQVELPSMRLRDFSTGTEGVATLVCAPFALHGAMVADFAPGHSLVEALRAGGLPRVYATDWCSATPEMRFFSIDSYLADLNVAVDELGSPVDLIGLCQGGWLALVYAARFPSKVRRVVLAGAPVDVHAGESALSRLAADVPLPVFDEVVRLGDGRVLGHRVLDLWGPALAAEDARSVLQASQDLGAGELRELEERFREWYAWTVDLPGTYYRQVISWLFKENRIAQGRFIALGRTIDLAAIRVPVFLLAARDDELVSTAQLFATARLIGTSKDEIEMATEPCGHLGLFLGAKTLTRTWPRIIRWLGQDFSMSQAS